MAARGARAAAGDAGDRRLSCNIGPFLLYCPLTRGFCLTMFYATEYATGRQNMATRDTHLIRQGNQFYLRLAIPRAIRPLFPSSRSGKPRDFITEPLGRDYTPARVEADRRIAEYRALFSRASLMTVEAVGAEIAAIKHRATGRKAVAELPMLESELESIRRVNEGINWQKLYRERFVRE